ncbi:YitT family protein [Cohnella lupini]|uniref:Putative 5xTM membrane YitT family protein n=1 Tax=Cohnella lupini TaxID=1294267 RepID=A0A3D9HR28_9BACL|nr:YitT family protein [Cohnella lupini]RED51942.1 putative 5xTM membrane YitT family protein [Cohnella lupini]
MDKETKGIFRKWLHIALGCVVTAAGLILLKHSHVVTGGTAGLSLSLSYLFQTKFHIVFLLLNIPFAVFAYHKIGRSFTFRTMAAISLLSALTSVDRLFSDFAIPALPGSIIGGAFIGVGICSLFKNGASLGGSTILALYMQKRYGLNPGKTNFAFDFIVVLTSFSAVSLDQGFISVLSIAVTSTILSFFKNRLNSVDRPQRNALPTTVTT